MSFFTFYLTGSLWLNLAIMFFIGLGVGSYEGVTDPMLLEIHDENQNLHINVATRRQCNQCDAPCIHI